MNSMYFEDFELGMEFESPRRTVTESDIVNFAGVSGDLAHTKCLEAKGNNVSVKGPAININGLPDEKVSAFNPSKSMNNFAPKPEPPIKSV